MGAPRQQQEGLAMAPEELGQLRRDILECNRCFGGNAHCRHHEDLVGGYDQGKVLVVGLNPQGAEGDEFYAALEAATVEQEMLLGDHLPAIFAGQHPPDGLGEHLYQHHPGREWMARAARCLGMGFPELAEQVRFVELFKHTTANQAALSQMPEWPEIQRLCPGWLEQQLEVLAPRLVIMTGNLGLECLRHRFQVPGLPASITQAHGRFFRFRFGGVEREVLLTYAFSRTTAWRWSRAPLSEETRRRLWSPAEGGAGAAGEREVADPETPSFAVESRHRCLIWQGAVSEGEIAAGYEAVRYIHLLPLSARVVGRIAEAAWQGNGGRKYGPLREEDGAFAPGPDEADAWYFSNDPGAYFPGTEPRLRARLEEGRPVAVDPGLLKWLL